MCLLNYRKFCWDIVVKLLKMDPEIKYNVFLGDYDIKQCQKS